MTHAPATQKNPNPQGKGLVPILDDWSRMLPATTDGKSADEFLRDYCLSCLVLNAEFQFRPVKDRDYYLYAKDGAWKLSLISPEEWNGSAPVKAAKEGDIDGREGGRDKRSDKARDDSFDDAHSRVDADDGRFGHCLARCRLRHDMTWELFMREDIEDASPALRQARSFVEGFVDGLLNQTDVDRNLPRYEAKLPYYQRMLATALSVTLERSLDSSGIGAGGSGARLLDHLSETGEAVPLLAGKRHGVPPQRS